MKILALEFSSSQRSVAVLHGPAAVQEVVETGFNEARPLTMVDQALRAAALESGQIECLAVGLGPGSYTGIRSAIALAQGWQLAREVRILGVSSAECLACQAQADGLAGRVAVVVDAQRGEFYLSVYEIGPAGCQEVEPLRIVAPAFVREREQAGDHLIGPEITRWFPTGRNLFPRAQTLATLASGRDDFVAGEGLVPIYLRETTFVKAPPARLFP
jgi:tRNA threonylcarbamoyl adenosine modification protein YeaZ